MDAGHPRWLSEAGIALPTPSFKKIGSKSDFPSDCIQTRQLVSKRVNILLLLTNYLFRLLFVISRYLFVSFR
jgi:hypothetical protein